MKSVTDYQKNIGDKMQTWRIPFSAYSNFTAINGSQHDSKRPENNGSFIIIKNFTCAWFGLRGLHKNLKYEKGSRENLKKKHGAKLGIKFRNYCIYLTHQNEVGSRSGSAIKLDEFITPRWAPLVVSCGLAF